MQDWRNCRQERYGRLEMIVEYVVEGGELTWDVEFNSSQTGSLFALGCCRPHPVLMGDPAFRSVTAAALADAASHRQVTGNVKFFD